jgi:hypothetical protein
VEEADGAGAVAEDEPVLRFVATDLVRNRASRRTGERRRGPGRRG